MAKITPNIEDYLEAILEISNEHGFARVKDIAAKLDVKNPSVTQQIQKLSGMKLVMHKSYGNVTLTEKGREIAVRILRRHHMFQKLLGDILQLPHNLAEEDACRMEHAIAPRTMERLSLLIDFINDNDLNDRLTEYINRRCEEEKEDE